MFITPTTTTSGNSYYVDSPNTMNTEVEGMYDSLDRSQNRRVVMTTPAQYEEPDKDAARPLILPQSDDQYYLGELVMQEKGRGSGTVSLGQ